MANKIYPSADAALQGVVADGQTGSCLAACRCTSRADRPCHPRDVVPRGGDAECHTVAVKLSLRNRITVLEIEYQIRHRLRALLAPAGIDQSVMLVQCPTRLDAVAAKESPGFGIDGIDRGVIFRPGGAADLILLDTLQLPAQGIAEHPLQLIGGQPRRWTLGYTQTFDRRTKSVCHTPGALIIPCAERQR